MPRVRDRAVTIGWTLAFLLALAVQVDALYTPQVDTPSPFPQADKVVHAALFGVPMVLGALAGIPSMPLAVVLLGHAVVSEVVQATLLPHRDGDVRDALADAVGILLALAVLAVLRRRHAVRSGEREHAR